METEEVCAHQVARGDREVSMCGNYSWMVTAVDVLDHGLVSVTANGMAVARPRHALVRIVKRIS